MVCVTFNRSYRKKIISNTRPHPHPVFFCKEEPILSIDVKHISEQKKHVFKITIFSSFLVHVGSFWAIKKNSILVIYFLNPKNSNHGSAFYTETFTRYIFHAYLILFFFSASFQDVIGNRCKQNGQRESLRYKFDKLLLHL